jgi:hypothetical protein
MSALDDAIAAHLAHPAGSQADALTESLTDQALQPLKLREGWENEPIEVPFPWHWRVAAVLAGVLLSIAGAWSQTS